MRPRHATAWLLLSAVGLGCRAQVPPASDAGSASAPDAAVSAPDADTGAWRLVWQDEFDGPAGQPPAGDRWAAEIGGHGWGNGELQFYTDRTANASLDGEGHLDVVARREQVGGREYTSARLVTRDRFEQAYGRFEARIQLPYGKGLWPAFWLLGANFEEVGWPECGEIDVLELKGHDPRVIYGSLHGPGYSGGDSITGAHAMEQDSSAGFHVYAVEWSPDRIVWSIDGEPYHTVTSADLPPGGDWVYDHPFFLILNVAVGGHFVGAPDGSTEFPQTMRVDHVRVYERAR